MTPINLSYQCYQNHFIGLLNLKRDLPTALEKRSCR